MTIPNYGDSTSTNPSKGKILHAPTGGAYSKELTFASIIEKQITGNEDTGEDESSSSNKSIEESEED